MKKNQQEMAEIERERRALEKENKMLKNPTKYKLFKVIKGGAKQTARGFGRMAKEAQKANKKRKRQGKVSFGLNPNFFR